MLRGCPSEVGARYNPVPCKLGGNITEEQWNKFFEGLNQVSFDNMDPQCGCCPRFCGGFTGKKWTAAVNNHLAEANADLFLPQGCTWAISMLGATDNYHTRLMLNYGLNGTAAPGAVDANMVQPQMKFCASCGAQMKADAQFCPACGASQ